MKEEWNKCSGARKKVAEKQKQWNRETWILSLVKERAEKIGEKYFVKLSSIFIYKFIVPKRR